MYLTNDGLVISGLEIILIIFALLIIITIFISFGRINRYITSKWINKSDDYPGSTNFEDVHKNKLDTCKPSDITDMYNDNGLNSVQEKVIFEEIISDVSFRYDEKTRVLTIEEMNESTDPIEVKLNSLDELREFVNRLEDYVNK
jgi:hypothetical protein